MPAVVLFFADSNHDARRLARLEDYYDLVWVSAPEVRRDELVAAAGRSFDDWRVPLERAVLDPALELLGNPPQQIAAHRVLLAVGAKETDPPLRLLERLNQSVEQDAIKAPVAKADAVLVMLEEGVHGTPGVGECHKLTSWMPSADRAIGGADTPANRGRRDLRVSRRRAAAARGTVGSARDIKGGALG